MNKDFPKIISFLRKDRGLSQKRVAADLEISQALLSHYEKGIRECGLDFLIKIAEYYDVSCDYLLGRTVNQKSTEISDNFDINEDISLLKGNVITQINKKQLLQSTSVIFDILAKIGNKNLTSAISNYLMEAEYQVFRKIYSAENNNNQSIFSISNGKYSSLCNASMLLELEIINSIIEDENISIALSPDIIATYFDKNASSIFNIIQYSERNIKNIYSHTNLK
ncbi:MAG: helix-turn-helix transcriptional regulator [Ruminococcus sp.]|nr:helix-turn-helix transcriptional regulator [Ruminococcus sp.]